MTDTTDTTTGTVPQATSAAPDGDCGCRGCGCDGEARREDVRIAARLTPEVGAGDSAVQPDDLDARLIPPAVRHDRIFEAIGALLPGEAFVLANDHDPRPLRYQLDVEQPGEIAWEYLAEGPGTWRVLLTRTRCC